ncbi:MAG: ADP-ribosylglycohydrolase family protein [Actinomycetota bacterium]
MTSSNKAPPDRIAGALLGLAAGDALGAGYEFGGAEPDEPKMIGGGLGGWDPGEWTDDTQMAICISEVTATGATDPSAIGDRFLDWYRGRPADVGVQTRAVLGDPRFLPDHRRPPTLGGTGKDPVYRLRDRHLPNTLEVRRDPDLEGHALLEPRRAMAIESYEEALVSTRRRWRRIIDP